MVVWIDGFTGAIYVATTFALIPSIGVANLIVCVIDSQKSRGLDECLLLTASQVFIGSPASGKCDVCNGS